MNMMLGLGIACVTKTARLGTALPIKQPLTLKVSGAFLLLSIMSSLLVVPLSGFHIGRHIGLYLFGLYAVFMATALYVEISSI
jgi:sodium/potassium/calcium exchanger 6